MQLIRSDTSIRLEFGSSSTNLHLYCNYSAIGNGKRVPMRVKVVGRAYLVIKRGRKELKVAPLMRVSTC